MEQRDTPFGKWPPLPDETRSYYITRSLLGMPPMRVDYTGTPPCLWCGEPVWSPSMDGPLVCPPCDMNPPTRENQERFRANLKRIAEEDWNRTGDPG